MAAVTWDPAYKGSEITLSNGDLSAGGNSGMVRATTGKSAGKWYFEILFGAGNSSIPRGGVVDSTVSADTTLASTNTSIAYTYWGAGPNGRVMQNSNALQDGLADPASNTVGVAVDMDAGTLDFYVNGAHQGAQVTGIKSYITTAYPAVLPSNTSTGRFTAASQTYAAPSGYSAWEEAAASPDSGFLMTLLNGAIQGIKGAAKSALPYFDGSKWAVKEAGTTGQVLSIDSSGDLAWADPTGGSAPAAASETVAGIAELATAAEVTAGTDAARIVTPATLAARITATAYAHPTGDGNLHVPVAVVAGTTTWDPAKCASGVTLSGGNLAATGTGATDVSVMANSGKTSGKWYFEILIGVYSDYGSGACSLGLADAGFSTANSVVGAANACGRTMRDGYWLHDGVWSISNLAGGHTGDALGFAVDMDNGYIDCYHNGAGTGSRITGIKAYITEAFPAVSLSSPGSITGLFSAEDLAYAPPEGYSAWEGAPVSNEGKTLTVVSGVPTWETPTAGGSGTPASTAEVITGTENAKVVTPLNLNAKVNKRIIVQDTEPLTDTVDGDIWITPEATPSMIGSAVTLWIPLYPSYSLISMPFYVPFAFRITKLHVSCRDIYGADYTPASTTVAILRNGEVKCSLVFSAPDTDSGVLSADIPANSVIFADLSGLNENVGNVMVVVMGVRI